MNMDYSIKGLDLTEQFEGCSLKAYEDPTGTLTIGYGHTGRDVVRGLVWTQSQCQLALVSDIQIAVAAVNKLVTWPLNQNQFDALVDFTFNEGEGELRSSCLLKDINAGNMRAADIEFSRWVYSKRKILPGLVKRRLSEAQLFNS